MMSSSDNAAEGEARGEVRFSHDVSERLVTQWTDEAGQPPMTPTGHDEAKLISKTLPEKHTKHCVLEKSFLDSLRFAK